MKKMKITLGVICSFILLSCNSEEKFDDNGKSNMIEYELTVRDLDQNELDNLAEGDTLFFDGSAKPILKEGIIETRGYQDEIISGWITVNKNVKYRFSNSGEKLLPNYLTGAEWRIWDQYVISMDIHLTSSNGQRLGISYNLTGGAKTGWSAASSNNQTRYQHGADINNGQTKRLTTWVYRHVSDMNGATYGSYRTRYLPMDPSEIRLYYTIFW